MEKLTFKKWLQHELFTLKCVLLTSYEQKDQLIYIERPHLEQEYMEKVGDFEQSVIQEEIECELLKKKQQMVQIAINRQEAIDEEAIDAEINVEREKLLKEAIGDGEPKEYADLDPNKEEELKELYSFIVKNYHPHTNSNLTDIQKQLFEKAQNAYRRKDIEALKLIYDMIKTTDIEMSVIPEITLSIKTEEEEKSFEIPEEVLIDYTLISDIYDAFKPYVEELEISARKKQTQELVNETVTDIESIRSDFPFTAAEMLADPVKTQAYKEELAHRLRTAQEEIERRSNEIKVMIAEVQAHE